MPVYAYRCADCGSNYERLRGIASNDSEVECPGCGGAGRAKRLLSAFAAFSKTDGVTRPANTSAVGGGNSNGGCKAAGGCACHGAVL